MASPTTSVVASIRDWYLPLAICLIIASVVFALSQLRPSRFPTINGKRPFEYSDQRVKQNYSKHAHELLQEGLTKYPGKPFRMIVDYGYVLIFPPEYAQELRNIEDLSHVTAIAQVGWPCYERCRIRTDLVACIDSQRSLPWHGSLL